MLTITRTWNAICSAAAMRRAIALARDYGHRRAQFGAPLAEKPLHLETLADLQCEAEVAFHLAFRCAELLGAEEAGAAPERDSHLLRLLTPLAKLVTGKQAVVVASEVLEIFGGNGYVEDTGIPRLLRDAQVLPIWEGTTNVLSLDTQRAIGGGEPLAALSAEAAELAASVRDPALAVAARAGLAAVHDASAWLSAKRDGLVTEGGLRGFSLTLGRAHGLLLLCRHAQWSLDHERDRRSALAAARFARRGLVVLRDGDPASRALANDEPVAV